MLNIVYLFLRPSPVDYSCNIKYGKTIVTMLTQLLLILMDGRKVNIVIMQLWWEVMAEWQAGVSLHITYYIFRCMLLSSNRKQRTCKQLVIFNKYLPQTHEETHSRTVGLTLCFGSGRYQATIGGRGNGSKCCINLSNDHSNRPNCILLLPLLIHLPVMIPEYYLHQPYICYQADSGWEWGKQMLQIRTIIETTRLDSRATNSFVIVVAENQN